MGEEYEFEDKRSSKVRWAILILCCLSTVGDYYCLDNIGVLYDCLKDQFVTVGDSFDYYFGLLYSVYSFPNIILPLFGGILITIIGDRTMYIAFCLFITLGQFIVALGSQYNSIEWMLVGRVIFGIGGECINISQNTMILKWFYKSQLALPLGLTLTSARIGTVLNGVISPRLAPSSQSSPALWFGLAVCIMSFIGALIMTLLDLKNDESITNKHTQMKKLPEANNDEAYTLSWSSLKEMTSLFWLLSSVSAILYGVVLPFNYIASGFLTSTAFSNLPKEDSRTLAGLYMNIPFFISSFFIPSFGAFLDKFGQRAHLCLLSSILAWAGMLMFSMLPPLWPLIALGFSYSLFAAVVWPTVSIVVNKSVVGLAFGITTSMNNAFLAVIPMIVAGIMSTSKDYFKAIYFFSELAMAAMIICIVMIWVNSKNNNVMNITEFEEEESKMPEKKKQ